MVIFLVVGCQGEEGKNTPVPAPSSQAPANAATETPKQNAPTVTAPQRTPPPVADPVPTEPSTPEPAPDAAPTAESPPTAGPATLTDAEANLLWPSLSELRQGVRPFSDQSVGICRCNGPCGKTCDEFIGLDVENPPPGRYQVRAALHTPRHMPDTMKTVDFAHTCTKLRKRKHGEQKTESSGSKPIRIRRGKKAHGFRISRSLEFVSPSKLDELKCDWSYTIHNLDGDKTIKGSYRVTNAAPAAPVPTAVPTPPATPEALTTVPPRPAGPITLSVHEATVFGEALKDLRAGVRPFNATSVGICRCGDKCDRECNDYMGLVVKNPPAGTYQVRAALHTPRLMPDSMLQVDFDHECEVTIEGKHGTRTTTDNYNRTFQIGKSNRKHGYRLTRTKTFKSPRTKGRRHCTWRYTLPGVNAPNVIEGSYTLEAAPTAPAP